MESWILEFPATPNWVFTPNGALERSLMVSFSSILIDAEAHTAEGRAQEMFGGSCTHRIGADFMKLLGADRRKKSHFLVMQSHLWRIAEPKART